MKIRSGFVSNSSSSSFLMVVSQDTHDKVCANMSETEKKVVDMMTSEENFGQMKVRVFSEASDMSGNKSNEDMIYDAQSMVEEEAEKRGVEVSELSEHCDDDASELVSETIYNYQEECQKLEGGDCVTVNTNM